MKGTSYIVLKDTQGNGKIILSREGNNSSGEFWYGIKIETEVQVCQVFPHASFVGQENEVITATFSTNRYYEIEVSNIEVQNIKVSLIAKNIKHKVKLVMGDNSEVRLVNGSTIFLEYGKKEYKIEVPTNHHTIISYGQNLESYIKFIENYPCFNELKAENYSIFRTINNSSNPENEPGHISSYKLLVASNLFKSFVDSFVNQNFHTLYAICKKFNDSIFNNLAINIIEHIGSYVNGDINIHDSNKLLNEHSINTIDNTVPLSGND